MQLQLTILVVILSLSLFESWVLFVDYIQNTLPANDFAISTALFNRCTNFHNICFKLLFIPENDPSPGQIIRAHLHSHFITRQNPDIIHSHLTWNCRQYFMTIFQLHPEHCIGKGFDNWSILFYKWLFTHTIFRSAKIGYSAGNKKKSGSFYLLNKKFPYFPLISL